MMENLSIITILLNGVVDIYLKLKYVKSKLLKI